MNDYYNENLHNPLKEIRLVIKSYRLLRAARDGPVSAHWQSSSTLVLIFTAAFIFHPRKKIFILYKILLILALLLFLTISRTAIIMFMLVTVLQLVFINWHQRSKLYGNKFLIALGFIFLILFAVFAWPLYRFFTMGGISTNSIDLIQLTNGS